MLRVVAAICFFATLLYQSAGGIGVWADEPTELDAGTAALIGLLPKLDDPAAQVDILQGIRDGLRGKRRVVPPEKWQEIYTEHLARSESAEVRQLADLLALQFGDEAVREALLGVVSDEAVPLARRREALAALAEVRAAALPEVLLGLLEGSSLRPDALQVLAELGGRETTAALIQAYPDFDLHEKRVAIDALSSGVVSARALLAAVEEQRIPRTDLNAETIRRLKLLDDEIIDAAIAAHWGTVRETPEAKAARIEQLKGLLSVRGEGGADLPHGRAIFAKTCRQCHTLYGDGEKVGPDITGSNRRDLDYLLVNVVDPNSTVGKDYQAWSVMTDSGKLLVGLLAEENDRVLTLRTETDTITIPKDEIEHRDLTPASMMPEGLFDQISESDLRDLVAYLRGSRQVPLLATKETAGLFFNGQDLTHWNRHGGRWQVVDGEIHGTADAASPRDAVLVSDLLLDNCVVDMELQLMAEQGSASVALVLWNTESDAEGAGSLPVASFALELAADGQVTVSQPVDDAKGAPPLTTRSVSNDRLAIQIVRSPELFQVTVDGRELVATAGSAVPRFRVAFVMEGDAAEKLIVRNLRLTIGDSAKPK